MAGGISGPFIRLPIATSLLMVGILFVGIIAYPQLPVAPLPGSRFPDHFRCPPAFPARTPRQWRPRWRSRLNRQFALIPGVSEMTSSSQTSSTQIVLQFDLSRNIDGAGSDVLAAINAGERAIAQDYADPPDLQEGQSRRLSPILMLGATSDTLPMTQVSDEAYTKLAQAISQINGVGQVTVGGQADTVNPCPDRSRQTGRQRLSLEDVRTPLSGDHRQ